MQKIAILYNPVYYLTDAMGSVIGLADGSGSRVGRFTYDGFGNFRNDSNSVADVTGGDFRFQGQWLESESGLYYMRARDYGAYTGKFINRDPVDLIEIQPESVNSYQFVSVKDCHEARQQPLLQIVPSLLLPILYLDPRIFK